MQDSSVYDLDIYLNRSCMMDNFSSPAFLITYNINNGVQIVGHAVDPPPYSQVSIRFLHYSHFVHRLLNFYRLQLTLKVFTLVKNSNQYWEKLHYFAWFTVIITYSRDMKYKWKNISHMPKQESDQTIPDTMKHFSNFRLLKLW